MTSFMKKTVLASGLAAFAMASATPASAQYYGGGNYGGSYGGHRHHDDTGTAVAIGAGLLGIIAIAAIASSNKNKQRCETDRYGSRYCYDRNQNGYNNGGYYNNGNYNNGGYYNGGYNNGGYNNGGYNNDGYNNGGYRDYDRDNDSRYRRNRGW